MTNVLKTPRVKKKGFSGYCKECVSVALVFLLYDRRPSVQRRSLVSTGFSQRLYVSTSATEALTHLCLLYDKRLSASARATDTSLLFFLPLFLDGLPSASARGPRSMALAFPTSLTYRPPHPLLPAAAAVYKCPHTSIHVCPHTAVCVLILLYMCPQATLCAHNTATA